MIINGNEIMLADKRED